MNGSILWANLHLLFWLSLMPIATEWIGTTGFAKNPVAAYGIGLIMSAIAYTVLEYVIMRCEGEESKLKQAIHSTFKEYISIIFMSWASVLHFFILILP